MIYEKMYTYVCVSSLNWKHVCIYVLCLDVVEMLGFFCGKLCGKAGITKILYFNS